MRLPFAEIDSPIYSLILGTKTYVVLSSPETIRELLDKKSNIYSSRPEMYMGQGLRAAVCGLSCWYVLDLLLLQTVICWNPSDRARCRIDCC